MTTPVGRSGPDSFNQGKEHTLNVASPIFRAPLFSGVPKSRLFTHQVTKGENALVTRLAADRFSIP